MWILHGSAGNVWRPVAGERWKLGPADVQRLRGAIAGRSRHSAQMQVCDLTVAASDGQQLPPPSSLTFAPTDVTLRRCIDYKRKASFGSPDGGQKDVKHCMIHRLDGEMDLMHARRALNGCDMLPSYGSPLDGRWVPAIACPPPLRYLHLPISLSLYPFLHPFLTP